MTTIRRRRTSTIATAVALVWATAASSPAWAQTGTQASPTRRHVETLASPKLEGREAGSDGERAAGAYLAAELARIGARPLPGRTDMFQPFAFTAGADDAGSRFSVQRAGAQASPYAAPTDVRALSFSDDAEISGAAVFAGYGIVVPETQGFSYDSYAGLDVADKIVVVLRYFPEDAEPKTRALIARYADLRYKAMAARQRGARALVVVTGPRSPNAGELVPMTFDTALAGSGLPAVSISGRAAEGLFAGTRPLREVQQELDSGNPHVTGFDLPGSTLTVRAAVTRRARTGRNVVAYLPATEPTPRERPWVVLGAHFDHLGSGSGGNSLATAADRGRAHLGADDNASGTAAVVAIGEALASRPRARHVLLALWSAEEIGLVGSNAFVNAPPVPLADVAAYFNFDMVGRMQDNRLIVQATGTSAAWAGLLERVNVAAGFEMVVQPDPYQPTDVSTFNQAGVPSLSFTTGVHSDYHKPSDTADRINYPDLDRLVEMAAALTARTLALDAPPQFVKVEQSSQTAGRTGIRVFTGTVPDYASNVKGLLLSGVIGGGPAEQAGLQKGDVIVEIAGQTIANIYDYTYALELLRVGQAVPVAYMRNGERRTTSLTPAARR